MVSKPNRSEKDSSLIDIDATFLPTGQMRQVARVTELCDKAIVGEVDVGPAHWVYPEHFPGDPIFPGTLMIEAAGQLVALWAWAHGARGKPRLVRANADFRSPVSPGELRLGLHGKVVRRRHLHFGQVAVTAADREVASITLVLAVLDSNGA